MSWNDERDTIRARMVVPEESAALASGRAIGLVKRLLYNGVAPRQVAGTAVTFTNFWSNAGGLYLVATYVLEPGGWVTVAGVITGGTLGLAAFALPIGYRPSGDIIFPSSSSGAFGTIAVIAASGQVVPNGPSNVAFSLGGVRFQAA